MKKTQMKKTIAIATGLLLATGLFANKAQAVDAEVDFTGTVVNTCTLTMGTAGSLFVNTPIPMILQTENPAQVTLKCSTGSAVMSISDATKGGGPEFTHSAKNTFLSLANNTASSNIVAQNGSEGTTTSSVNSQGTNKTLYVFMNHITSDPVIPAGIYTYSITVTATPE